ncbi:binding--dependent transport system inner membrane component family protein [Clostridium argentinense CDC 2741]|uniref:Binding--dependent transport system inner membrane component family protein n=1 Tax=Clostridium argentinense CDC 2741 TaxID=1418104 RepID=A0A0C1TXI6_9CLOT|nr:extracellular solute-binding protein [Clostridium argentinense]ARC86727.1 spermidine/putrescine ABC transporter permease [Clostridium argentinense]KIE45429.1 binding--dependent transport system inner membrane component family protein [Clostridium argentinense CDC 2741]NFF38472.1 extracellular solute-binding protein [Clostridium argentinense]NFP49335.1 extracellular solute-binding protein [Clostridium argentinense]NFP71738.1 extracellular solute-binding protein [Clostridium argentinense]
MDKKKNLLSKIYAALVYGFLYLPILVLVVFSFNKSKLNATWSGFTLDWYKSLLNNAQILEALKNSLIIAFVSTFFAVVIGTLAAIGMYRYKFKGKKVMEGLLYIPVVIPEIVMGISMLAFFSLLNLEAGLLTLILAHITFCIAYVIVVVRARLDGFDIALEEAALDLGATPWQTLTKVTLPVISPGIIAGGLLAFTLSLDDVIISFFASGPDSNTLPLKIFSMVKFGVTPEINALSTVMMVFTLSMVLIAEGIRRNALKNKKIKKALSAVVASLMVFGAGFIMFGNVGQTEKEVLNLFNWSEFLPQSVVEQFEKEYNVKVNYATFSSNEEMLAKLMGGNIPYDLVVTSDYAIEIMIKQKLIQEIDKANVPNLVNIDKNVLDLGFDPNNKYSLPYMWGGNYIVVDRSKISKEITSFDGLWDSEFKNSMVILDDPRVIVGMALQKNGYSINTTNPEELQKAKEDLIKLMPNIKAFDSESPKTLLINGEASIGYVWGTEAYLAKLENPNLETVLTKEGVVPQYDNFVIPAKAKNKKLAEEFINFIYRPEISAQVSEEFPYANPNQAAYPLIDPGKLNDIAVYPPREAVEGNELIKDVGEATRLFDDIWTEVKNSKK